MKSVAIIGSGPIGIYALQHLIATNEPLAVTVFEASDKPGVGMPYDPALNADYMLCNAFSREIPGPVESLLEWLKTRPARELSEWELSSHDLSARAFYPRVLIGEYLAAQFAGLLEKAKVDGRSVSVRTGTYVTDILPGHEGMATLRFVADGTEREERFDAVVIASGHTWPKQPTIGDVELLSPWPYTNLLDIEHDAIGILGSSLSAIDVIVALGHAHGSFDESGDTVTWTPSQPDRKLAITMVSRHGIMPEGDFYYAFPYEPLRHISDEAVDREIERGTDTLLRRVFDLLCAELDAADPGYLAQFPPSARTLEGFAEAYFSKRQQVGGLDAVKRDLVEARASLRRKETIPHRYALLRGHETFDRILRLLSPEDYRLFLDHLMPVFADCYAAVPHLSLARIVAMYDAGVLDLLATEDGAEFGYDSEGRIRIGTEEGKARFDVLIDARGQSPAPLDSIPFPGLLAAIADVDAEIEAPFALDLAREDGPQIYCLALPQLLQRHPFCQGLVECNEFAQIVAGDIGG
ncbi:hypothetical protein EKN06_11230 [Croceicoccus ponticola]|uniref:FAD-dependent urate hydroxylase HpyO/Asp monooxygenase CreE-like FAD/NAD(P)-binding domain-containing protein n=1 Tax=Croceicoccus ponticola TaxID=2217664 RepID=A0A437GWU2_9SPHN|nr:FAD/NAD(P)-binding protein [Croceicoccus ponticola]RVQ66580.1 hypothetical protein EKN06_11230 [Croceicoccus ponticola]